MSFSQSVKDEILKNIKRMKGCCATSFLTAVLRSVGSVSWDEFGLSFCVESDNENLSEFCSKLAEQMFDVGSSVLEIRPSEDSAEAKYVCRFDVDLGQKLGLTRIDEQGNVSLVEEPHVDLSQSCCRRAFMQGLFLSCGSVSVPEAVAAFSESKHGSYHLELRFANANFAEYTQNEFPELDFRQTQRKNYTVLYLKDSAKIADFFVFVDAVNAKFKLENILIERSYRNTANRQRNCIDSNIDKTVLAGQRQLAAIEKLKTQGKFDALSPQLKEVAAAREEYPEANLSEIAAVLGISKSGANHRLVKLVDLASQ